MTERAVLELDTLIIRIPIRLQRRGGRKLIMTLEGVAAPAPKPSRDETLIKPLVPAHRWRRRIESSRAKSIAAAAAAAIGMTGRLFKARRLPGAISATRGSGPSR